MRDKDSQGLLIRFFYKSFLVNAFPISRFFLFSKEGRWHKMKEFRTMKYHYKANSEEKKLLKFLCRISKNVYNTALYDLRQQYFKDKLICTYFELNKIVSTKINYHILNTYQSICTIRLAHSNMEKYITYHNPDGTLNELGYKFSEENDCTSFPKYKKK